MDFTFLGLHSATYFWRMNCHYHSWGMHYTGLLLLIYSSNTTCASPSPSLSLVLQPFLEGKPMSTELGGCFQKPSSKFKAGEALLCANKQCSSEKGLKQWCFISQASPFGGSNILAGSHGFWWVSLLFFSQVVPCSWDTSTSTVTMITQNYKAIYNAL